MRSFLVVPIAFLVGSIGCSVAPTKGINEAKSDRPDATAVEAKTAPSETLVPVEATGGPTHAEKAEQPDPAADPMAYLNFVRERSLALQKYRLRFTRRERLGLIPSLRKAERIDARFRSEPFSVYFLWRDDDSEYAEAAFVRGRDDDKVLLLPRRGLLGLPPTVGRFNVQDAVSFQKARNPITDFGLARMMERTIDRVAAAESLGGATVRYVGREPIKSERADNAPLAHRFELTFPQRDPYPNKRMDLYIDPERHVPMGVWLWLPDGKLDAMYTYENIEPAATWSDNDFEIVDKSSKTRTPTKSMKGEPHAAPVAQPAPDAVNE